MSDLRIIRIQPSQLDLYAAIPMSIEVTRRVIAPDRARPPAPALRAEAVVDVYSKDYDGDAGFSPVEWPARFDLRRWGIWLARRGDAVAGGVAVAPAADALGDHAAPAVAAVWDLRVAPDCRRAGVGSALIATAEHWAEGEGYGELRVETQDVNVPACRFYQAMGFRLVSFEADAYPACPGEARIVWAKPLVPA